MRALFAVGRGLGWGELGCALSHLEAYQRLIESGADVGLVLEDDVVATDALLPVVREVLSRPRDWDVVTLHSLFEQAGPEPVDDFEFSGGFRVCRYRGVAFGAQCYLVTAEAARRLLDTARPIRYPADDLIFRRRPARLRVLGVEPRVVEQRDFESELVARESAGADPAPRAYELPIVWSGKLWHRLVTRNDNASQNAAGLLAGVWRRTPSGLKPRLLRTRRWAARHNPGARVRWGNLRRRAPFSSNFALDRGLPIDRYYIRQFVGEHAADVRGAAMEMSRSTYTSAFRDAVSDVTIVDIDTTNSQATYCCDLCLPDSLPKEAFDCIVFTQTLQYLPDLDVAIANLWEALRPGGVMLMTVPALAREDPVGGDYWRFTPAGLRRALRDRLPPEAGVEVTGYGNSVAAIAQIAATAVEDVHAEYLAGHDPAYTVIVGARVSKPASA